VLCSYDLSLWSRMDRPLANDSQRSEQIVVFGTHSHTRLDDHPSAFGNSLTHALHALHARVYYARRRRGEANASPAGSRDSPPTRKYVYRRTILPFLPASRQLRAIDWIIKEELTSRNCSIKKSSESETSIQSLFAPSACSSIPVHPRCPDPPLSRSYLCTLLSVRSSSTSRT